MQEDGSLGFVGDTDSLGQAAYGDRGTYQGQVTLNNGGLVGSGKLNYLDAEIESGDIRFGVDSTTTTAEAFTLKRAVGAERSVPQVEGARVDVTFRPYGDSMIITPLESSNFQMYGEADRNFNGVLVLTPKAPAGKWDA